MDNKTDNNKKDNAPDLFPDLGLEILPDDYMKPGRGGGKKPGYTKYADALHEKELIEFFKTRISQSKNGTILLRLADLAAKCDMQLKEDGKPGGLAHNSLEWGFKYVLYEEGFWLTTGTSKKDEPIVAIRYKTNKDQLPRSLIAKMVRAKGLEKEKAIEQEDIQKVADAAAEQVAKNVEDTGSEQEELTEEQKAADKAAEEVAQGNIGE